MLFGRAAKHIAPGDVTLFAHAKGVTRHQASTSGKWVEAFEELYLDYWPAVADLLRNFPVVGAFKKMGAGWPPEESLSDWHYSGSWFWFRNSDLFSRDWSRIDPFWCGIESFPSLHFAPHEAGKLNLTTEKAF